MQITKVFLTLIFVQWFINAGPRHTIMIDPAGNAKNPGRTLHKNYARSETFRCAQALKHALEERHKDLTVLLTRDIGDALVPLQIASYANRANLDLFFHIDFHTQSEAKTTLQPLYFVADPLLDFAPTPRGTAAIIPLCKAHTQSINTSKIATTTLKQRLEASPEGLMLSINTPKGLPFKPLFGIQAPSIALDIGLATDDQWTSLIKPLVDAIGHILYTRS